MPRHHLCEHVAEGEALQLMIEKVRRKAMTDDECFARYKVLCTMKEVQTRAALSCATKMRLTRPTRSAVLTPHTRSACWPKATAHRVWCTSVPNRSTFLHPALCHPITRSPACHQTMCRPVANLLF